MFKIYIKDYKNSNGSLVTEETLVQEIPAEKQGDLKLIDPKVKNEMGSSETLNFSIEPGTKFYDAFLQMKTYMRITYDNDTIFYGRVLTITNNTFRGTRQIRMEGPLAFLTDSPVEGVEETKRAKITTNAYIAKLLNNHNAYCASEPNKRFILGIVPGNDSSVTPPQRIKNDTQAFGSDSWTDTKAALEDLRSHYGGYFRTRAAGRIGDGVYLDWMNHYFNSQKISQKIEVGYNVLDISNVTEINNIFTAIIPIGRHSVASASNNSSNISSNGSSKMENLYLDERVVYVPDIIERYGSAELNSGYHKYEDYRDAVKNYGVIIKTVTFQDANTKEKLRNDAYEWIKNNYQGGVTKFTIKAVDMHQIGDTKVSKIMIGDQVEIRYPVGNENGTFTTKTITLTCLSIDFDLYHPENNSYTFGIPANMLTKTYGVKKAGSVNSGITDPPKATPTHAPDRERPWIRVVGSWLMDHKLYYRGPKPFVEDAEHRAQMYARNDEDNQIYWPAQDKLYDAYIKNSDTYIAGSYRNFKSDTPPREFDEDTINAYHICEYVKYMYGIDLRTDLEVPAPDITINADGSISFWQKVTNAQGAVVDKIKNFFIKFGEVLSTHKLDVVGPDGQEIYSYMDSTGNWHYYYNDPETGERVETNIRELDIRSINTDNKVGWIIGESDNAAEAFGQITLGIENYAHGPLVTARISGELMYLGNYKTEQYTAVSLNHMDQVCGDFDYVTDPNTGIASIRVNSGGGMRVWHAKKNADGTYERDSQGRLKYAEYGIYDDNTLTGGIITEHLADGTVTTKISGNIVDIDATQVKVGNTSTVSNWLTEQGIKVDDTTGLLADKITAYEARFSNINAEILEAKNITSEKINAAFVGGAVFNAGAIRTGSLIVSYPMGAGSSEDISFGNGIKKLKIFQNGNNYTLKYLKNSAPESDGNYIEIENGTFSRAVTSWNKGWSNGVLTITPIPQGTPSFKVGIGKSWRTDNIDLEVISNGAAKCHKDSNNQYVAGQIECPTVINELTGNQPNAVYEKDVTFSVSSILETKSESITTSSKTFTPSEGYIGIGSITVIPTHSVPSGTAINANTIKATGISITADGKSATARLDKETFRPTGTTSDIRGVKLTLGSTVIGRIDTNSFYTDGVTDGSNSVTASTPQTEAIGANATSNIRVRSVTSTGKTGSYKTLSMSQSTYSAPNVGSHYCVNVSDGSTVVGRYDVQTIYNYGVNSVTLGSKTISSNGTYYASSDSLRGYSSVTVSVPSSPAVNSIDLDNVIISTYQPGGVVNPVLLTTLANAIKNNRNTYIWFRVRALSGSTTLFTKWYYCASA